MKKTTILIISILYNLLLFGQQQSLEMKITRSIYEVGKSSLTIDLEFINKSPDTLYILKPINKFFNKGFVLEVNNYPQLNSVPYKIIIESNIKCPYENVYGPDVHYMGEKKIDTEEILIIKPYEKIAYNNIQFDYIKKFCDDGEYKVMINYNLILKPTSQHLTENDKKIEHLLNIKKYNIKTNILKCSSNEVDVK